MRELFAPSGRNSADLDYVSSPLGRARETMELVRATLGLSPNGYRLEPRLAEISFGDWEGFTIAHSILATPNALRRANMTNGILCHRVEKVTKLSPIA